MLSGSKTFITNAPYADVFLIYARVRGGELDGSIQPFIVERAAGPHHRTADEEDGHARLADRRGLPRRRARPGRSRCSAAAYASATT